jgi:uncharacterized metal-binding protein YceD (DUF177 family)
MTGPFSRPLDLAAIPAAPIERAITAAAAELAAVAAAYAIPEVHALSAVLTVGREPGGVIRVKGRVAAEIVQACVVSLVPVPQVIDEAIDMRLAEATPRPGSEATRPGAEVMIDPAEPDPPDIVSGPAIDLGAIAVEHFLLAVDPYPRAPGAELPAEAADPSPMTDASPFAALARLRGDGPR